MSRGAELDLDETRARVEIGLRSAGYQGTISGLVRVPAGLSSLTYRVEFVATAEPLILKAAPPGLVPTKNRDVIRQAGILRHLKRTNDVPIPSVVFSDAGDPPAVPPIFAMSFVEGESYEPLDDEVQLSTTPEELESRYLHAARILGSLHRTALEGPVFDGEPEEDGRAELDKWSRVFHSVPEDLQGSFGDCEALLRSDIPAPEPVALVHGDYRLGNTICRAGAVAAVIDWEIWGLGDPRCDLAWFLHMSDPQAETAKPDRPAPPSRERLIDEYVGSRGRGVVDLTWFEGLALYKRAAATALIVKHNRRASNPDPTKAAAARVIEPLLELAVRTLSEG